MDEKATVLLVEDDAHILKTNKRILEREGFSVLCAGTVREARAILGKRTPDVLVLDIQLPDGSGLDLCREIRHTTAAPVLFLTALDEKSEVIEGLVAGGNDYLTKPYDVDEFVARVRAQLALARMNRQAKHLTRGPLTLDTVAMRAYLGGEDMALTAREFSLLHFLVRNEGKTLTAEEIYEGAWHQPMLENSDALYKGISRLKAKLKPYIEEIALMNFRGKGYLLEILSRRLPKPPSL